MTRIRFSSKGTTAFEQLLGHNTDVLKNWKKLEETLWKQTSLDENLLEQIRRATAFENGCEYCMVKGGKPDFDPSEQRISIAVAFAIMCSKDHHDISQAHFDVLSQWFSDREMAELCAFIVFIDASQKFGKMVNLTEEDQPNAVVELKELKRLNV